MGTRLILEGVSQFFTWMVVGLCIVFGLAALVGLAYFLVAMARIGRETGGAKDGPHRGTIGDDGRL
jgi:hypothetical protein